MTLELPDNSIENLKIRPSSSLVELLDYNGIKKTLRVKYKKGRHKGKIREYSSVDPDLFSNIISSKSVGRSVLKMASEHKGSYVRDWSALNWLNSIFA